MKHNKTTTAFILDKRREKLNGMYPVKLRVIHNRQNQLYGTSYSFTEEDFNKIFGEKPRGDFKNYQIDLNAIEAKADAIIKKLKVFSFDAFKKEFFDKRIKSADVFSYFQSYIDELLKSERIGNAIASGASVSVCGVAKMENDALKSPISFIKSQRPVIKLHKSNEMAMVVNMTNKKSPVEISAFLRK